MADKTRIARVRNAAPAQTDHGGNPVWFKPLMLGFMAVGLAWIIVYYVASSSVGFSLPIPGIGSWNILIGFAVMLIGFLMTTRWR